MNGGYGLNGNSDRYRNGNNIDKSIDKFSQQRYMTETTTTTGRNGETNGHSNGGFQSGYPSTPPPPFPPIGRKREFYTDVSIFEQIDQTAISVIYIYFFNIQNLDGHESIMRINLKNVGQYQFNPKDFE